MTNKQVALLAAAILAAGEPNIGIGDTVDTFLSWLDEGGEGR